jgi:glycosyltransferase involved in cell wall biosynthesis
MDEIGELRRRGVRVICCSGKRVSPQLLSDAEKEFWNETSFFHPLSDTQLLRAVRRLGARNYLDLMIPAIRDARASMGRRARSVGHTLLGGALADELDAHAVDHIHAHHGYFASWMALVAARLLGISFSFTLHGSDLLLHGDLLAAKLRACRFCVTVSNYNREYILHSYRGITPSKVLVQRLGVDPVEHDGSHPARPQPQRFCLLSVGRLHAVKNHEFLIRACAVLRDSGLNFSCWIAGEGPERKALEYLIADLRLDNRVLLLGHVDRAELSRYYRYADLVALTSASEGLPVVLMEAMAYGKLVLAPAITGIPELVNDSRNGFLYRAGSLMDFVSSLQWIVEHQGSLGPVRRAAAESIALNYDRQRNLRLFADQFLQRIATPELKHASSLLQQVQLSV